MHIVFEANAEFTADVDAGLVAEGHVRPEFDGIAAHQIWPLMPVHAHAMAQAMREVFVAGAIACISNHFSCSGIDRAAFHSWTSRCERRLLRPVHDVEY